jgi:hypothetical protein
MPKVPGKNSFLAREFSIAPHEDEKSTYQPNRRHAAINGVSRFDTTSY